MRLQEYIIKQQLDEAQIQQLESDLEFLAELIAQHMITEEIKQQ
jgi:hypothetical protein